eukprot:768633-Hanusia_phi.AAC.9
MQQDTFPTTSTSSMSEASDREGLTGLSTMSWEGSRSEGGSSACAGEKESAAQHGGDDGEARMCPV